MLPPLRTAAGGKEAAECISPGSCIFASVLLIRIIITLDPILQQTGAGKHAAAKDRAIAVLPPKAIIAAQQAQTSNNQTPRPNRSAAARPLCNAVSPPIKTPLPERRGLQAGLADKALPL